MHFYGEWILGFYSFEPEGSLTSSKGSKVDIKQIKQIIDLISKAELTEFSVEEEGFKLKIARNPLPAGNQTSGTAYQVIHAAPTSPVQQALTPNPAPSSVKESSSASKDEEAGFAFIKSPMVGTFYRAASPDAAPFISEGSKVENNTPVCIIEAMKIMNEIQAELKGTIVEILVENGAPVEYGQKLFKVKQA